MEDYIGARVDYEPKYKDVLTYFQNIGNLYTWEADPWYETCKSWAETCYIHAGIPVAFRACVEDIRTMLPQGMARLLVYPVVRYIVPIIIK